MTPSPSRNAKQLLSMIKGEPEGLTRAALAERAGLSRSTVQSAIKVLTDRGLVEERGPDVRAAGRPANRLVARQPDGFVVGLDYGQAHLRIQVSDGSNTACFGPESIDCFIELEGLDAIDRGVELIERATAGLDTSEILAVAVGIPAPITDGRFAAGSHLRALAGVDLHDELSQRLTKLWARPFTAITIENDANLGALGETASGAALGCTDCLYAKISSGVGFGLILSGGIYRGAHGAAGEWGHAASSRIAEDKIRQDTRLELPRDACNRCDRLDCLENLASCRAIAAQVAETERRRPGTAGTRPTDLEELMKLAGADEPPRFLREAIQEAAVRIAYSLSDLARMFDPERIVVGGLLGFAREWIEEPMRAILELDALPPATPTLTVLDAERIKRSEIDGAIAVALAHARRLAPSAP